MNICIHRVTDLYLDQIETKVTGSGREYSVRHLVIKTKDGDHELTLFSDKKEEQLEFVFV